MSLHDHMHGLPPKPGVYIFRDGQGEPLYIGKAVNLRQRVRSYLQSRGQSIKIRRLLEQAHDVDYVITDSELEALLLECNLIKKHRPKYNVRLRDDKHYPYIKVDLTDPWPRVYITRKAERDGARYFGPYADSTSVRRTLDLLNKLFPYRSCTMTITGDAPRPCLDYHIRRCLGPCIGAVSQAEYRRVVDQVCLFLEGKHELILKDLRQRMGEAADRLEFERAAWLRDQIRAVEKVAERQKIISTRLEDQDAVAFARANGEACVEVFFIRGGKVMGREHFLLEGTQDEDGRAILAQFITQFYDRAPYIPPEILVGHELERMGIIEQWLREKRGDRVTIRVPRRGPKRSLLEEVAANAAEALEQMRQRWMANRQKASAAANELAELLQLDEPPRRIECYDVSNVQGTAVVGAMVVFEDGQPVPGQYRRFQIKAVDGQNDFAALQEMLRRRFRRALAAGAPPAPADDAALDLAPGEQVERGGSQGNGWAAWPNLVIIDGGRGQLNAALDVLRDLGLKHLPVVALAKQHEEVYTAEHPDPLAPPRGSQVLFLLQRIRDETHRSAVTYHRRVRGRRALASPLDEVPGIGGKRKTALLRYFGSLRAIQAASVDDLARVPGMTRAAAERLKSHL
ncbi:MAG: excinuclease ABC subunit UvrC [Chloroflexi bacterium]|nr:excinuclease ABC subunit UvrC [Chloroflexota bacterium]